MENTPPLSQADLHFLQNAIQKRDQGSPRPAPVLWVWAAYVLIGYPLLDFAPAIANWYFLFATIAAVILSGILGRTAAARHGQADAAAGLRQFTHWMGGMLLAVGASVGLACLNPDLHSQLTGQFTIIMVGLIYFTAGIHFDRAFIWMGLLLVAGGVFVSLLPHFGWTVLGLLLGGSLLATSFMGPIARPLGAPKLPTATA